MLKHLKINKRLLRLLIVSVTLILLSLANNSWASEEVVFQDISQVTVDLQKFKLLTEENLNLKQTIENNSQVMLNLQDTNNILIKQNDILKEQIKLYETLGESQTKVINNFKELIVSQQQMYEIILKSSKPSAFDRIFNNIEWLGVGVVVGAAIIAF